MAFHYRTGVVVRIIVDLVFETRQVVGVDADIQDPDLTVHDLIDQARDTDIRRRLDLDLGGGQVVVAVDLAFNLDFHVHVQQVRVALESRGGRIRYDGEGVQPDAHVEVIDAAEDRDETLDLVVIALGADQAVALVLDTRRDQRIRIRIHAWREVGALHLDRVFVGDLAAREIVAQVGHAVVHL